MHRLPRPSAASRMIPIVTDPWFYAVAVPAVLLTGLSKSGFASGFGALAVPLMALAMPVPQAAAIMLPLLMVMDGTGLQQLWRERDRALVRLLLPAGLLGHRWSARCSSACCRRRRWPAWSGALTLAFLAQRLLFPPRAAAPPPSPWLGSCLRHRVGLHELRRPCRRAADQRLRAAAAAAAECATRHDGGLLRRA